MFGISKACVLFLLAPAKAHKLVSDGLRGSAGEKDSASIEKQFEIVQAISDNMKLAHSMSNEEYAMHTESFELCAEEDREHLKFVISNSEGTHDNDTNQIRFGWWDLRWAVDLYFLKDVVYCPATRWSGYKIVGTKLSADEFKVEVKDYLEENNLSSVLYNIHGMNTSTEDSFLGLGLRFKDEYQGPTNALFIPIMWRNAWELSAIHNALAYDYGRNTHAIRAGKLLAEHVDVFNADYTTNIMCHSQGNFVFRVFVQNIDNPEVVFDKIFLVAADARSDMFADGFNPAAPRTADEQSRDKHQHGVNLKDDYDSSGGMFPWNCRYDEHSGAGLTLGSHAALGVPVEECELNGGLAMTNVANHVHVLWNAEDATLEGREHFQRLVMEEFREALGRVGDKAESYMNLQYFKERVTFHDFTGAGWEGDQHNYQLECEAVEEYFAGTLDDQASSALPCRVDAQAAN